MKAKTPILLPKSARTTMAMLMRRRKQTTRRVRGIRTSHTSQTIRARPLTMMFPSRGRRRIRDLNPRSTDSQEAPAVSPMKAKQCIGRVRRGLKVCLHFVGFVDVLSLSALTCRYGGRDPEV
jgi:hypothetical protein